MNPVARKNGLVVRELPGEVVVYDLERHEAHCLNATAAAVFRAADGRRSPAQIARHLADTVERGADEALVGLALAQLGTARLLEGDPGTADQAGVSRREVMRRVGLGAALLPLVTSVLAPTPAEAAATCVANCSGQPAGTPCNACGSGAPPCTESCDGAGNCSDGC